MGKNRDEEADPPSEESFWLSMLPFAGLGLILVTALLWRFVHREATQASPQVDTAQAVIAQWDGAPTEEIPIAPGNFTLGPADAPVTLVEFSDFQCPYCRAASAAVKVLLGQHGDKVRLVFKDFPLDTSCNDGMSQQLHPLACRAAVLALCAGQQKPSAFWEAHDAMFAVDGLSQDVLDRIPHELSVSTGELQKCMESEAALAGVKQDIADARKLKLSATPTFFLNGRQVSDYRDGVLGRLVEHVLKISGP